MGLFSKLFGDKKDPRTQQTGIRPTDNLVGESFDFQDDNEKAIEKWIQKIDQAEESTDNNNPDKVVEAYKKAIRYCDEFKEFCYSYGSGGKYYYDENEAWRKKDLEDSLNDFLKNSYDEEKAYLLEEQAAKNLLATTKSKIIEIISSSPDGIIRTNICSQFDDELKPVVFKALDALGSDGKIVKGKQGNNLLFKIK